MAPKRKSAAATAAPTTAAPAPEAFTPERFERELKDLAAKAREETWGKRAVEQVAIYAKSALLLALVGIYSNVSQLTLSPVYGAIPSAVWHSRVVMAACFAGWSGNLVLKRQLAAQPVLLLPWIAVFIPMIQFYLFKLSGFLGAHWGPAVTEVLTLFPLVVISASCVATYLEDAALPPLPKFISDALPGLGSWGFFKLAESWSGSYVQRHVGETFLHTRLGLQLLLAASYTALAPSRMLQFAVPALVHLAIFNTHVMSPMAFSSLQDSMAKDNWTLLDRRESLTGYISVFESAEQGFRVMRCDHSLLGGEWIKWKDGKVAEPIYGVFVMLEAVRLVEVPKPVPDNEAKALVIGLGIGTTPGAFIAHGIDTTVVEIDPAVYDFAEKYFGLASNHTPVIADAVSYTAQLVAEGNEKFDYIVHDVFTGGAEPIPLFTLEFLQGLSALLKPDGVIAINYAGDFLLPSPKVVVQTIRQVFPSCRIFREAERPSQAEIEKDRQDFTNMVIFCQKVDRPMKFRRAGSADYLRTRARVQFLNPKFEVVDADFATVEGKDLGILTSNDTEKLAKWHEQSALGHWDVMRTVLPSKIWESW